MFSKEEIFLVIRQNMEKGDVGFVRETTTHKLTIGRNRIWLISKEVQGTIKNVTTVENLDISQEIVIRRNMNKQRWVLRMKKMKIT